MQLKSFNCESSVKNVGSVVEWLKHRTRDQHGLGCILGKDTLRHIPLLGGPGKQF